MSKLGGESTRELTELTGIYEQDKRLIKLMAINLATHATDTAKNGTCRLKTILLTLGSDGVLLYNCQKDDGNDSDENDASAVAKRPLF